MMSPTTVELTSAAETDADVLVTSKNRRCYEKAGYTDTGKILEQSGGKMTLAVYEKQVKGTTCKRPITTLFMLMSVDGKISTGADDSLDVDRDFPKIDGVSQGLHQYYEIERTTDLWSLNSGRVQAKMGVNEKACPDKSPVSFVVIDNSHLTEHGVRYFCALSKEFVLVTTNHAHPAYNVSEANLHVVYQKELNLRELLELLCERHDCKRITIQTGGMLNGLFLREKLFDYVDIVVAPILIGGKDTATLIDGRSLTNENELARLGALRLEHCDVLEDSYIRLRYRVLK